MISCIKLFEITFFSTVLNINIALNENNNSLLGKYLEPNKKMSSSELLYSTSQLGSLNKDVPASWQYEHQQGFFCDFEDRMSRNRKFQFDLGLTGVQ